jgi:6-phosphogluconolactonase
MTGRGSTSLGPGRSGGPADEPEIVVVSSPEAASEVAAERIAARLAEAVAARGRSHWATTGGSTPTGIYRRLAVAPLRDRVPWDRVHLWWGDDRYVPRDHPLSNVLAADQVLLAAAAYSGQSGSGESGIDVAAGLEPGVALPVDHVHAIPMAEAIGEGGGPAWAATGYDGELRGLAAAGGIEVAAGFPVFDLILLGVGPDGHVLSVFPGSPTWDAEPWALDVPAPSHVEPHVARVTLHPGVLGVARSILVVAHGEAKAEILRTVLGPERDPRRWPAQAARRAAATWILDAAAAARLSP